MNNLEQMFPSLTLFSDLDWATVTQEYEATSIDITFPEYLQKKAEEGDCPIYLFELAFFEMAAYNAKTSTEQFPFKPGVYLNPTALFLNLEFDIPKMLEEADKGNIEIIEKPHILCIYRDRNDEVNSIELDDDALSVLEKLENGPLVNKTSLTQKDLVHIKDLVQKNLILEII